MISTESDDLSTIVGIAGQSPVSFTTASVTDIRHEAICGRHRELAVYLATLGDKDALGHDVTVHHCTTLNLDSLFRADRALDFTPDYSLACHDIPVDDPALRNKDLAGGPNRAPNFALDLDHSFTCHITHYQGAGGNDRQAGILGAAACGVG